MSKRIPRPTLLRGLIKRRMVSDDKPTVALIHKCLDDEATYRALNDYYTTNRGYKWVGRFKTWSQWLWQHREAVFRILGIVVMFAEDGTPTVETVEAYKSKPKPKPKPRPTPKPRPKVTIETIHGDVIPLTGVELDAVLQDSK